MFTTYNNKLIIQGNQVNLNKFYYDNKSSLEHLSLNSSKDNFSLSLEFNNIMGSNKSFSIFLIKTVPIFLAVYSFISSDLAEKVRKISMQKNSLFMLYN